MAKIDVKPRKVDIFILYLNIKKVSNTFLGILQEGTKRWWTGKKALIIHTQNNNRQTNTTLALTIIIKKTSFGSLKTNIPSGYHIGSLLYILCCNIYYQEFSKELIKLCCISCQIHSFLLSWSIKHLARD